MAYARMLGVAFDMVNYLSFQGVPWRVESIRRMLTSSLSRVTLAVVEVRLLADEAVTRAAEQLAGAVEEGVTFAFAAIGRASDRPRGALLVRPKRTPVLDAPGYEDVLAKLGQAATAFINATKAEMKLAAVTPVEDEQAKRSALRSARSSTWMFLRAALHVSYERLSIGRRQKYVKEDVRWRILTDGRIILVPINSLLFILGTFESGRWPRSAIGEFWV